MVTQCIKNQSQHHFQERASASPPTTAVLLPCHLPLLHDAVRPKEVPRRGRDEAPELADGLTHGAGVV